MDQPKFLGYTPAQWATIAPGEKPKTWGRTIQLIIDYKKSHRDHPVDCKDKCLESISLEWMCEIGGLNFSPSSFGRENVKALDALHDKTITKPKTDYGMGGFILGVACAGDL